MLVFVAFALGWGSSTLTPSQDAKRWSQIKDHMSIRIVNDKPYRQYQWYVTDRTIPCRDNGESFQQSVDESMMRTTRWRGDQ